MKTRFCRTCGEIAKPKKKTPGSFWIECLLWLFFILPGLIYSIWRLSTRHPVCRHCGSWMIIPPQSPAAMRARRGASDR